MAKHRSFHFQQPCAGKARGVLMTPPIDPAAAERALMWAMRYCTWTVNEDAADPLPRPFMGRISSLAFNTLLRAVVEARDAGTLPTLQVGRRLFPGMSGSKAVRLAAVDELTLAGLVSVAGPPDGPWVWTLNVDGDVS
jgi:hypothetical protein